MVDLISKYMPGIPGLTDGFNAFQKPGDIGEFAKQMGASTPKKQPTRQQQRGRKQKKEEKKEETLKFNIPDDVAQDLKEDL